MDPEKVKEETKDALQVDDPTNKDEVVEEYSATEQQAMGKGWKPKDQFEGPEEDFVSAGEFNRRGELFDAIHELKRSYRKLNEQHDTLVDHHKKVEQAAYDRAIKDLKAQKKAAVQENDLAAVVEIDDKIDEIKERQDKSKPAETKKDDSVGADKETVQEWTSRNPWYNTNPRMADYAQGIGFKLESDHPDWNLQEILIEVEKKVKEQFPENFGGGDKSRSPAVTKTRQSNSTRSKSKLPSFRQLPDDAKVVYNQLVKGDKNPNGVLDHDTFMKEYVAVNGPIEE